MTLTDEIYHELMDGLRSGVDYEQIRLKWEGSKGPFYNALQRVFAYVAAELGKAFSDQNAALQKSGEAQQRLALLEAEERKIETEVKAKTDEKELLGQQTGDAGKQLQKVNGELAAKKGLLNRAAELEEKGFGPNQLQQLHETLVAIGTKRGAKPKQAVAEFFNDLQDYDAKTGFEQEVRRLDTVAETSRLEAKKWQAEERSLERAYKYKKKVIDAMGSLLNSGVKPEDIPVWGRSVQAAGGVEELSRDLARYKSVRESVAAWHKEIRRLEMLRAGLSAEVDGLEKRKAEMQGLLTALSKTGIDEIKAAREEALSGVTAVIADLTEKALAVGEDLGRYQAILDSNEWARSLSSLIKGNGEVTAVQVRVAGLTILRPIYEWMKTYDKQASLPPQLMADLYRAIQELEQWQP